MKIAFDLDKNYELNPSLFDSIAKRFQQAGHKVGILTARHSREGYMVTFAPDFVIFLDIGDLDYQARAIWKANTMRKEKIDILFDDRANLFPPDVVALKII